MRPGACGVFISCPKLEPLNEPGGMHPPGLAFASMSQNNNLTILYAGLDVAKDSLALDFQGAAYALTNDPKGHTRLVRILQADDQPVHVVLEATGGYEQPAVRALHLAGLRLSVLEPSRVRALARAKGLRAK